MVRKLANYSEFIIGVGATNIFVISTQVDLYTYKYNYNLNEEFSWSVTSLLEILLKLLK